MNYKNVDQGSENVFSGKEALTSNKEGTSMVPHRSEKRESCKQESRQKPSQGDPDHSVK